MAHILPGGLAPRPGGLAPRPGGWMGGRGPGHEPRVRAADRG